MVSSVKDQNPKYYPMGIRSLCLCLLVCLSPLLAGAQSYYNVVKYGARNDSTKLSSDAIRKAIDAAVKAGGGTVYFPAGNYLTGPIHLKSNITILIDAGATIHFSDNFDDYLPMVESRWEGIDVVNFSPLFYAYKAENIAIRGRGTINGHGKKWWDFHHKLYDKSMPVSKWQEEFKRVNPNVIKPDEASMIERGFLRPPFIQPMYCKNVLIEGITIRNSPFWTVNPEFCENVTVHGVTIINPHSPNTDGINPESCRYVHISDCHISVGDDCITIKSGKDAAGRKNGNTRRELYHNQLHDAVGPWRRGDRQRDVGRCAQDRDLELHIRRYRPRYPDKNSPRTWRCSRRDTGR